MSTDGGAAVIGCGWSCVDANDDETGLSTELDSALSPGEQAVMSTVANIVPSSRRRFRRVRVVGEAVRKRIRSPYRFAGFFSNRQAS